MQSPTLHRELVRAGAFALAAVFVLVALLRFTPAPPVIDRFGSFLGSLLPAVIGLGLYALLSLHRDTVTLRLAVLSAITLAFATLLQTILQHMGDTIPRESRAVLGAGSPEAVTASLAALIVALHMAKGALSALMVFLFGLNMLRHPRFGPIIGGVGIVLGVVEYSSKIYWFPQHGPLIQAPFTAAWLLVVLFRMATSLPWVDERIAAAAPAPSVTALEGAPAPRSPTSRQTL